MIPDAALKFKGKIKFTPKKASSTSPEEEEVDGIASEETGKDASETMPSRIPEADKDAESKSTSKQQQQRQKQKQRRQQQLSALSQFPWRQKVCKDGHGLKHEMVKCRDCQQNFWDEEELERHRRRHQCVSVFKCCHCVKTFKQHFQRERHEAIHKEKPRRYRCGRCDGSFDRIMALKSHERTHQLEMQKTTTMPTLTTTSTTTTTATTTKSTTTTSTSAASSQMNDYDRNSSISTDSIFEEVRDEIKDNESKAVRQTDWQVRQTDDEEVYISSGDDAKIGDD